MLKSEPVDLMAVGAVEWWLLDRILPYARNAKTHDEAGVSQLAGMIREFGWTYPILVDEGGVILAGHKRKMACEVLGLEKAPVLVKAGLSNAQRQAYRIADNKTTENSAWDEGLLKIEIGELQELGFDLGLTAFAAGELEALLGVDEDPPEDPGAQSDRATLAERFIVPPFSVLDARQGYWQDRKRAWLSLGIQSELGRGIADETLSAIAPNETGGSPVPLDRMANGKSPARTFGQDLMRGEHTVGENRLTWVAGTKAREDTDEVSRKILQGGRGKVNPINKENIPSYYPKRESGMSDEEIIAEYTSGLTTSGTSIFDPVLCELAYTWFTPPGGAILDPFAGGSVRGIVAAYLGRKYTGVDLRAEQVDANRVQGAEIVPDNLPVWIAGNSLTDLPDEPVDFVFSCPPYYDLEIYSEQPGDLSNVGTYADFLTDYRSIVAAAVARLRDDRFACFCVGDIRGKDGFYQNFVSDTIAAFQDAGATLYNEAILVTVLGSLPIRAGKQFSSGRKLGKTHQNVLVFCKGDWKKATQACGPVDVADLAEMFGEVAD
jgi:hypothetical protein